MQLLHSCVREREGGYYDFNFIGNVGVVQHNKTQLIGEIGSKRLHPLKIRPLRARYF